MVSDEESQCLNSVEQDSEVIEEIFPVEEVVRCQQEVPRQTSEPRQAVNSVHLIADGDDFLETLHLNRKCL